MESATQIAGCIGHFSRALLIDLSSALAAAIADRVVGIVTLFAVLKQAVTAEAVTVGSTFAISVKAIDRTVTILVEFAPAFLVASRKG
jgi:hypothetical protein